MRVAALLETMIQRQAVARPAFFARGAGLLPFLAGATRLPPGRRSDRGCDRSLS